MKIVVKKVLAIAFAAVICVASVPAISFTVCANESKDIQVYSSVVWPEYACEDYYTVTVDSVGRKATLEYTFVTEPNVSYSANINFRGFLKLKTQMGSNSNTNTKSAVIRNDCLDSKKGKVTVEYDFSEKAVKEYENIVMPDASEKAEITYDLYISNASNELGDRGVLFSIKNGKLILEPKHSHEDKLLTQLKEKYNAKDFESITSEEYSLYNKNGFIDILKKKVKEITKGCNSDVEKYFAIHDWICNNISYDWMAFDIIKGKLCPPNSNELISIATNPEKVYKYKRAICEGYSRFGSLMLRAAGIPAMYISGIAYSHGGDEGLENTYYTDDDSRIHSNEKAHAWNALYVGGKWMLTDFTWDSDGEYHGDNSPENVNSRMRYRRWGNRSCGDFGSEHISFFGPNGRLDYTKNDPFKDNKDDKKENTLDAVKINKVTSLKNGISLSWKKRADITGYEIQCSKNKKFTSIDRVMKVPVSKTTAKITKLKKKTIYYVRIHVYKKYGNQELSGAWSSVKKVKTN